MTNHKRAMLISTAPMAFASAPPQQYRPPETEAGVTDMQKRVAAVEMTRNNRYIPTSPDADEMMKRSPDSAAMVDYWDLVDVLVDGTNAIRAAGARYLPKFTDEQPSDYKFRLEATKYTNVYRDIVESLASKPFEQEVALVEDDNNATPALITEFIEDVDGSGNHITQFASATFFNGINSAIDWILIDHNKPDPNVKSLADYKAAGIRPYWSHVLGRNVLWSKSEVINGEETLTYVKIYEPGVPDHIREFERALNGIVTWTLWVKTDTVVDGKTQFAIEDAGIITIGVIPLVPFATGRRDGRTFRYFPAMRDAADLQVELYQQESGLKFAKLMAAYPMLAGDGVKPKMQPDGKTPEKLSIGPGRVLYGGVDGAGNSGSWKFVEPAATSLTFLAADIKETIAQLRELGRQPLTAQSAQLTVITAATAAGKAKSAVGAWALTLKDALENALVITCLWLNIKPGEYDPMVNVYTEFDDHKPDGDLDALKDANTRGKISDETFRMELRKRGVLSTDVDEETETDRLLNQVPADNGLDTGESDLPAPGA